MCGLCFFFHVVEYIIIVAKNFIIIAKKLHCYPLVNVIKIDDIVHFAFTFSMKIILIVSCIHIYNKNLVQPFYNCICDYNKL
jgi:hypothetical protein